MMDNGSFDGHFVISRELLLFLEWLMHSENETLKKLVKKAYSEDFASQGSMEEDVEELQQNIIEFLALLDTLLYETVDEDEAQHALDRALIPALKCIDTDMYDSTAVTVSIEKATAMASQRVKSETPKDVFCKELLKRWKPDKKMEVN